MQKAQQYPGQEKAFFEFVKKIIFLKKTKSDFVFVNTSNITTLGCIRHPHAGGNDVKIHHSGSVET